MLKRIFIFPLLGPMVLVVIHAIPFSLIVGTRPSFAGLYVMGHFAYTLGALPALVSGLADAYFAKWLTPLWRAIATGFFAAFALGAVLVTMSVTGIYGLAAFAPAAVCSAICWWLDEG